MTTYRDFFDTTDDVYALMIFIGKAHTHGTLTRQRLVQVVVRCCETVAWRMPDASRTALADVAAWANGDDDVDLRAADAAIFFDSATTAAAYAACASYADDYDTSAAVYASDSAAYAADAYAWGAAYAYAAARSAMCAVVRDEITVEEICRALNVKPDEVMT